MAYISANDVKAIRASLKKAFGKTIKFSVTKEHYTKVNVCIMASSIPEVTEYVMASGEDNIRINHNWYKDHFKEMPVLLEMMNKIMQSIFHAEGGLEYYDNTDIQTDYFDTAFYIHVGIGKWDKPYVAMEVNK